jgi:hypothetical protein
MTFISDGWFQLDFDPDGFMRSYTVPWMKRRGEESAGLWETFGFIFVDGNTYILPHTAKRANVPALTYLMQQSGELKKIFAEMGHGNNPSLRFLPPSRSNFSSNCSVLFIESGDLRIERIARTHSVHPAPEIVHRVTNRGDRPISVNYYWCVGTTSPRYRALSEKGDLSPPLLRFLGFKSSIYLIKTANQRPDPEPRQALSYLNLNWGKLAPGESKEFRVKIWCVQHPWVGTQFSGIAFALSDEEPRYPIAALAATIGRKADGFCSILDRFYSPIFILSENTLPLSARDLLQNCPVRNLMTNVPLDDASLSLCKDRAIQVISLPQHHPDPFVATQKAIDISLGYSEEPVSIINVLPDDPDRQVLLSYYYSLRLDTPISAGGLTAPARNTFVLGSTIERDEFEWAPNYAYARVLGTKHEVSEATEMKVGQNIQCSRHEYAVAEEAFNSLLSYFAYHDYTLPRMALENVLDQESTALADFKRETEKETGQPLFWSAPLELIGRHGKTELHGPPFSVLITAGPFSSRSDFNAVVGAQYAKSLLACLHPVLRADGQSSAEAEERLRTIGEVAHSGVLSTTDLSVIQSCLDEVATIVESRMFPFSQILLQIGHYSKITRGSFGRRCIYLFFEDASMPLEVASAPDSLHRLRSVGSSNPIGRMCFSDPLETAVFSARNVLNYTDAGAPREIVVVSDPTGDLKASLLEEANVLLSLVRSGLSPKLLIGAAKRRLLEDGRLTRHEILTGSTSQYRISIEYDADEGMRETGKEATEGQSADEVEGKGESFSQSVETAEFTPEESNIGNFVKSVMTCTGLHYTGHGTAEGGEPALLLSDGNLRFTAFPELAGSPWVFLNACELGSFGAGHSKATANTILSKGARCVVAPFISIRDIEATDYAMMYDGSHLLLPAALSFHLARHNTYLGRGSTSMGHLAYIVYGDPYSPEGGELWELHDAHYYEHARDLEWQRWSKQVLDFSYRADRSWGLVISELSMGGGVRDHSMSEELLSFFVGRQHANQGMRFRVLADILPTSDERLVNLGRAAEAYRNALGCKMPRFNRALFAGYASHLSGLQALEEAALHHLHSRVSWLDLAPRLKEAFHAFALAEREFEKVGAIGDAAETRRLAGISKNLISRAEDVDVYVDPSPILHEARHLR